jgi:hypothetical protein
LIISFVSKFALIWRNSIWNANPADFLVTTLNDILMKTYCIYLKNQLQ